MCSALTFAPASSGPTVIFVIGANGMGKTTTIGKIASRIKNELNMTVLLGACDTFRAAAVEQLDEWSKRANVSIEKPYDHERGGDPVPVVSRSVQRAKDEGYDVVIIDTSGRLSNNFELTMQLQGMKKAITDIIPEAPHETLVRKNALLLHLFALHNLCIPYLVGGRRQSRSQRSRASDSMEEVCRCQWPCHHQAGWHSKRWVCRVSSPRPGPAGEVHRYRRETQVS